MIAYQTSSNIIHSHLFVYYTFNTDLSIEYAYMNVVFFSFINVAI